MRHLCLTLLLAALSPWAVAQSLYKSVDAQGKVVYSDKPPTSGPVSTVNTASTAVSVVPAPSADERKRLPKVKMPEVGAGQVVLYSAKWCGYCTLAKQYMGQRNIAYQEIDVDTPSGKAAFRQIPGNGIPVLLMDDRRVDGFTQASYDSAFAMRTAKRKGK